MASMPSGSQSSSRSTRFAAGSRRLSSIDAIGGSVTCDVPSIAGCLDARCKQNLGAWQPLIGVLQLILDDMRHAGRLRDQIRIQYAAAIMPAPGRLETASELDEIGVNKSWVDDLRIRLHHINSTLRADQLAHRFAS